MYLCLILVFFRYRQDYQLRIVSAGKKRIPIVKIAFVLFYNIGSTERVVQQLVEFYSKIPWLGFFPGKSFHISASFLLKRNDPIDI